MIPTTKMRITATAMLTAFALALTGCFVSPGKFSSELVLQNDGEFTFTYDGEIFFLGLSELAKMKAADEKFEAEDCYTDDYEVRECTDSELADQRTEWDAGAEDRIAEAQSQADELATMMGGIDPTDPEAAEQLRTLLLRHKGWERVEIKENGVYDIRYSASGNLSHDFSFPVIEGFPAGTAFVEVILRDENTVRVNAPGYSAQDSNNPMGAMMGGVMGMAALSSLSDESDNMPEMPRLEGTFTIVTNGSIRANNTDEGPATTDRGDELKWTVDASTQVAPTALIKLAS